MKERAATRLAAPRTRAATPRPFLGGAGGGNGAAAATVLSSGLEALVDGLHFFQLQ